MASPEIIRDAGIWLREFDLRGNMNAVGLQSDFERQECTKFGDLARSYAVGLPRIAFSMSGYPVDDAADETLFALAGLTSLPLTVSKAKATGAVAFVGSILDAGYSSVFDVARVRSFNATGEMWDRSFGRGRILHLASAVTATGTGASQQLRAISTLKKAFATLHVVSKGGTTPAITARIESDDNAGFTTPVTRGTFTVLTNVVGSQLITIDGPITDTWWRAAWTISGGTPTFSLAIGLGFEEAV